jgi:hypothetical protein
MAHLAVEGEASRSGNGVVHSMALYGKQDGPQITVVQGKRQILLEIT